MPNGPQLSEGLSKTIARIRSGEDLPLQEIQALSSSGISDSFLCFQLKVTNSVFSYYHQLFIEPRGTIQEATTTKFEEKLLKKKGIRGTKELLCITTAITSAFLVAVAAVAVRADFLALWFAAFLKVCCCCCWFDSFFSSLWSCSIYRKIFSPKPLEKMKFAK